MTTTTAHRPARRRRAAILITLGIVVALVICFFIFTNLYADVLWFGQLGYLEVLTTQWVAATSMWFIGFLGMAVPIWLVLFLGYRLRPVYAKLNSQLDRYQEVVEPLRRLAMWGIPIVFGLFAGFSTASRWQVPLMWLNATPSGKTDPQFHLDTSFYMFDLPFYHATLGFSSAVLIICFLATVATCYLYGSIRVSGRELRISRSARVQIAVIAALYLLIQAVSIWLDRYATVIHTGDLMTGADYTDVHATIPSQAILAGVALVVAALFVVSAFIGRWRFPLVGLALLLVCGILIGGIYPWVVQRFQVAPNEKTIEAQYIKRNIEMTRYAYGVSNVKEKAYNATTTAEPGALRSDAQTTANIRIMDPALISSSFAQLQQFRQYYGFPDLLNVDRYTIDGQNTDVVVGVRGINQQGLTSRNWYNDTLVYTHGYGLVAAYGNKRSAQGQPVFLEHGIPQEGKLGKFQPRVYFGEQSPKYSIVGGPKGSKKIEFDYPSGSGDKVKKTTFTGDGGPKLDSLFNRLVYALKFQDEQILLSDAVTNDSQILYDREPISRVQKVAPYLTLDSTAYPSVMNGHIVWIVDGYTTSDKYPYSHTEKLSDAIADTQTPAKPYALDNINYIRNSVKATVDAYSGKVTLYAWDKDDPVLKIWEKIFPATVKPMSDMSAQLISHVRYPQDLFKVQRAILGQYHVTNPGSFYSKDDAWTTPNDPDSPSGNPTVQPPFYLTMQVPGEKKPQFTLYSTYIPLATAKSTRNVLTGYLAVDSNAGDTAGKKASGYGQLTLLDLPKDNPVPGPGQVKNTFNSDPTISQVVNLLQQGQTKVVSGNLLTLPVGGGLLYVQPIYVQSTGDTSYPLLQKVLVAFGDKIAFEDTLDTALNTLFGGDSGASAGDSNVSPTTPEGETPPSTGGEGSGGGGSGGGTSSGTQNAAVQQALQDAKSALAARETALKAGDWAAYGQADQKLQDALAKALAAENGGSSSGSGSSGSSGSGSSGSSGSGSSGSSGGK